MFFFGGFRGHWVFGWVHKAAIAELLKQLAASQAEAAEWRKFALKGTDFAEELVKGK